jgi:hypothetical protein
MDAVRQPSTPKPNARPPTPAETARLVEEATRQELAELDQAAPVGAACGDRYSEGQMSTLTQ